MESLEARTLLSSAFSADEVYLSELINRARINPVAEAARIGIDFTDGLTQDEMDLLGPVEPLALDLSLSAAARAHSLDMITREFFDHVNPDGLNPTQRARAAGYAGVAGEAIGSAHNSLDALYEAWMDTPENRVNILSLFSAFTDSFHYDQLGLGLAMDQGDAEDHFTAMFGDPGTGSTARLLGVVYTDSDDNDFYSVGEGLGNVRIDVATSGAPDVVVATYTTDAAGNYQLELGDGSWIVTFTDLDTEWFVSKAVTTDGENVKLDTTRDQLQEPEPDDGDGGDGGGGDGGGDGGGSDGGGDGGGDSGGGGDGGGDSGDGGSDGGDDGDADDHADDGDYPNATLIALNGEHQGTDTGLVDTPTDTDLFYFTAPIAGELTVTLNAPDATIRGMLTLKSDAGLPLTVDSATESGNSVTLVWNAAAVEQYFLVVADADQNGSGDYTLSITITAPDEDDGDGGGDGDSDGGGDSSGGGGGGGGGGDDGDGDGGDGSGDGSGDGDNASDGENPPVDATSDSNGTFTVVRTDSNGRPILYLQQPDGSWRRVDLVGEAGGPTPDGRFSTFLDPSTGRSSIISATSSGLAVYDQDENGDWSVRNLSAELDAAPIASKPVTFTTRTGLVYTAGLDADGNLVTYQHTGTNDSQGRPAWGFEDLSTDHLAPQGQQLPELDGSTLISYVTGWNGLTIAGLDAEGNVFAAWWAPGLDRWRSSNLSAVTGAPKYQGTISAYLTPWNGINIAGTDINGDLSIVWWVPSFGGQWRLTKLNQVLDGPNLLEGTIASWVTPWGGLNVSGLTETGQVVVYWWTPTSGGWNITTLSDYIPDVDPPASGVIGHTSSRGVISIMGLSEAGDLVRYWWQSGEPWQGETL